MVFFVLLPFLPEFLAVGTIAGVFLIVVLDAPERLVLFDELVEEIIHVVGKHMRMEIWVRGITDTFSVSLLAYYSKYKQLCISGGL